MRVAVDLTKACRLLNHGPTVLVSSAFSGKRNVMAASWSMALDFNPPKVAVVIEESSFTRELVDASGYFALNIPSRKIARQTLAVGHVSGRGAPGAGNFDKFKAFDLGSFQGSVVDAPLIEDCVGWLECKVIREPHAEKTYDLFVAEVVAAWADDRAFASGHWQLPPHDLQTLHYVAGGTFFVASEILTVNRISSTKV